MISINFYFVTIYWCSADQDESPYIFGPHTHTHRIIYEGKLATRFYFLSNCERLIWKFHCRLSHK